jgi:FAD/FMN-containing dehydrogenase/Fe-S oxidoreductase
LLPKQQTVGLFAQLTVRTPPCAPKCGMTSAFLVPAAATQPAPVAYAALEQALRAALGDAVRFDTGHLAAYASDASNYRQVPIGVVVPRSLDEFAQALRICAAHDAPVLPRGGGTSQCGQTVNHAVVLDISRHCNQVLEIDVPQRSALVEPGVVCDALRDAAQAHGLTFGPDPATHSRCTLGGMIGNNSCGAHSVMSGKTVENVQELQVLTYDGAQFWTGPTSDEAYAQILAAGGRQAEIYLALRQLRDRYADAIRNRFPNIKRRVSGYNLDQLLPENGFNVARALVGTEGTCALTLRAKVRLVHSPAVRVLMLLGFPDIYVAADATPEIMATGPIAVEGLDHVMIRGLQVRNLCAHEISLLPAGNAWVVVEFGGADLVDAVAQAQAAGTRLLQRQIVSHPVPSQRLVTEPGEQKRIWSIRETGASATALSLDPSQPDPQVGWEDAAVDPARLGDYLRDFQSVVDRHGYSTCLYGHFGDGCVHARITFDLRSTAGVAQWRAFLLESAQLVVRYGGSLSGEHGDGQARAEFLPLMFGPELMQAMEEFKRIWDPRGKLNPGKVVHAFKVDENLRMGPNYKAVNWHTRLDFHSPEGNGFQRAVERCIGMGKCRSAHSGTMCPSYRATGEETQSTRGRARLLWEMLQGDVITDGWRSEAVKTALDTCIACKGCRSDCPTHTDMASYKAEFLSHYHQAKAAGGSGKNRPRQAWVMGRIGDWVPLAMLAPRLLNFLTRAPLIGKLGKRMAGIAPDRTLPQFAARSFRSTYRARPLQVGRPQVLLWVDTFSDHFDTDIAQAAVQVLAHAGFDAVLPGKRLCCGRPLYDFGFLDAARERLESVLTQLISTLDVGATGPVAVVGLEPGCMSVFRDELVKLFPNDPRASRLRDATFLLGDFLVAKNYTPASLPVNVVVHTHCHQRSLFASQAEATLLTRMKATYTLLDSGCCGMAGSFGFNPNHAQLSRDIGELALFPALRKMPAGSVVLTNGFSCREQIHQALGIKTLHLAQLLRTALQASPPTSS